MKQKPEQNKIRKNANQEFLSNQGTFFKKFKRKKNLKEVKTTPTPTPYIIYNCTIYSKHKLYIYTI